MILCDWRWKLAFFADFKRALILCFTSVVLLLIWDFTGIATGTFYRGSSAYMTGIELASELPLEEPVFLFFLTYLTINVVSFTRTALKGAKKL